MTRPRANPIAVGAWLAVLAAVSFGATTPLVQRFGHGVGPFATAAALYGGSALASLPFAWGSSAREAKVRAVHLPRLLLVALAGAAFAPVALAGGLQRASGTEAALLLNCEALFTVLLGRVFFREPIGRRIVVAMIAITAGGALLSVESSRASPAALWGALAVLGATLGWAFDNAFTRPLADLDLAQVVLWKSLLGAAMTASIAWLFGEAVPRGTNVLALAACGVIGYGMSLRLYLLAQRRLGVARTGSIFALAPFVGAAGAWIAGDRAPGVFALAAGVLFAVGIALHITESHEHPHAHEAAEHEHAHRHDDGHHGHAHDPAFAGEHSHVHRHEAEVHSHPHGPDAHHEHSHETL